MQMETILKDKMGAGSDTSHSECQNLHWLPTELNSSSRIVCTAIGFRTERHKYSILIACVNE